MNPAPLAGQAHTATPPISSRLPVAFVPNRGQWTFPAAYAARVGPGQVFVEERGWTLSLKEPRNRVRPPGLYAPPEAPGGGRGVALRLRFLGGRERPELKPEGELPGSYNFFLGNDPARWRTRVPGFRAVRYHGLYPGVDARLREEGGDLEYDLFLEPGADLGQVVMQVDGVEGLRLEADGTLSMMTLLGEVRQAPPVAWEVSPAGDRRPIACRLILLGGDRFAFLAPGRRGDLALVVDPKLLFSTLLGGSGLDSAHALAVDAAGAITVAGATGSMDFPVTPGSWNPIHSGNTDAFVARLTADGGRLLQATFLGGRDYDQAYAVALDASGGAIVTGATSSSTFPTTANAWSTQYLGNGDAFLSRLSPDGAALLYSTYLGGADYDGGNALAFGPGGLITVAGTTKSSDFPTTSGAWNTTHNGGWDAFLTRLGPTGLVFIYSTFLGGRDADQAKAIAVDGQGAATVAGSTASKDFPATPGAWDTTHNGSDDAFVARLEASGKSLLYSTFLGGTWEDAANAIAVDGSGVATVAGSTSSGNFPTTAGAWDTTGNGGGDAFVARLKADGSGLLWSTYLGGSSKDLANALAVDGSGAVTIGGYTNSTAFPTTPGAWSRTYHGSMDAFVTRLAEAGDRLLYSGFLGASSNDTVNALAVDSKEAATVCGYTVSYYFPTTPGAFMTAPKGAEDAFLVRLPLTPAGVRRYGGPSPGCQASPTLFVLDEPAAGLASFGLACTGAPAKSAGLLLLSCGDLPGGLGILGITLWVDLQRGPAFALAMLSDGSGESSLAAPLPAGSQGARLYAQYAWFDPVGCPGKGPLSASDALEIAVH